jgi:predicted PurR-regulated permease PerM
MSEKKAISRGVAIGLGLICILLAVGLIGAIVVYTSIMNNKDSQITNLQNQVNDLNALANMGKY